MNIQKSINVHVGMVLLNYILKEGEDMIQMVAGIVLGVMMSAVAALVAGCIYLDRLRYEIGGGEEWQRKVILHISII